MRVILTEKSRNGNNLVGQMSFDGVIVARDIQCTPREWDLFHDMLVAGAIAEVDTVERIQPS